MQTLRRRKGRDGFAMVTSCGIVLLVGAMSVLLVRQAQQETHAARHTRNYLKARIVAEAGANAFYNGVKTNFHGFGTKPSKAFGDGSYKITFAEAGENRALVKSEGRCEDSVAHVALYLRNYPKLATSGGALIRPAVLDNALTSGGAMTLNGSIEVNGDVASATSVRGNGASGDVNGTAYAPAGAINGKLTMFADGTSNDSTRYTWTWDSFLDIADYLAYAVPYDGRPMSSYPAGTIVSVNGSVTLAGNGVPIQCCIIATGDIHTSGQVTLLQPATYPTLVSLNGTIHLSGRSYVQGLVVAMSPSGTCSTTGGGSDPVNVEGAIVCGGTFKDAGSWVINYSRVELIPPRQTKTEDRVVVVAWQ